MTFHGSARAFAIVAFFAVLGLTSTLHGQRADVSDLRAELRARYDLVPLQDGIALVPRSRGGSVRMIQIVDGTVTVDGEVLTGRELTAKLGRDAKTIVHISYLDRAAQRELLSRDVVPTEGATSVDSGGERPNEHRGRASYGDRVRFGGHISINKDEYIRGEVVAIFGGADIDGEVARDVTVVMGPLTLGPNAIVRGDVVVVGGRLTRAPTAVISGRIDEIDIGSAWLSHASEIGGPGIVISPRSWPMGPPAILAGTTVVRLVLLVLFGLIILALGRAGIERIGQRAAENPLRAGAVGLLAELLFIPALVATIVILAISIVGIPLLLLVPFGIAAFLIVMLVGFVGASYHVGLALARRMGLSEQGGFLALAVGIVVVMGVTLIGRIGFLALSGLVGLPLIALGYFIEYLAWTIGFGAAILTWFDSRRARQTPPAPASPVVPTPLPS